jgi:hypothetical protein
MICGKRISTDVCLLLGLRRLPIALVYRSTAGWYLPVLKATFPSLVLSAKGSCGSDGGGDVVGRGVRGGVFEPDPDA